MRTKLNINNNREARATPCGLRLLRSIHGVAGWKAVWERKV
ncbi:MAG: hypothetical protein WCD86_18320 [Ktedonobacteraceae bacterium]